MLTLTVGLREMESHARPRIEKGRSYILPGKLPRVASRPPTCTQTGRQLSHTQAVTRSKNN